MPKREEPNLVFLDAMRGLATLVVFLGHVHFFLMPFSLNDALSSGAILTIIFTIIMQLFVFGHQAVILFVFLSGFWVAYSQMKRKLSKKDFLKRRITKVYLPYVFALIFSLGIDLIGNFLFPEFYSQFIMSVNNFFSTLFLYGALYSGFGSNVPLITVALIIFCYLLFAIFEKHLKIGILVGIIGTIAYFVFLEPILTIFVYWNIWLMGAIISKIYFEKKSFKLKNIKHKLIARIFDIITGLFILWVLYKNYIYVLDYSNLIAYVIEDLILGLCMSYLTYRLLTTKFEITLPKLFNKLSDHSYSLYLIHYPIIVIFYAYFGKDLIALIPVIILVTILTYLFNYSIIFSNKLFFSFQKPK
jgi:peptidoglycan/LPS O-acetylase OafA/YrhL